MMTSLTQYNSPHPVGMQVQHPGMGQQGHPGMGAHPGQPHMQQMVSGPGGPQVSQPMIQGMPPGAGGPSAHALQRTFITIFDLLCVVGFSVELSSKLGSVDLAQLLGYSSELCTDMKEQI